MSKAGTILIVGGLSAAGIYGLTRLLSASATADALNLHIDRFDLKSQGLKGLGLAIPKVVFKADIKADNPTDQDLVVSQPYLKVYYNNKLIGTSTPSDKKITLKAKDASFISDVDVVFYANAVLPVMPDFIKYLASRFSGKKPSRKLKIEVITSGNDINKTFTEEVVI